MSVKIIDTTLRDGIQRPGILLTSKQKQLIAKEIYEFGIKDFEIGTPAIGKQEIDDISKIRKQLPDAEMFCFSRANREDIINAAKCGVNGITISFPVSIILQETFNKSKIWVAEQMHSLVPLARKYFDHVYIGAQDASRAEMRYLKLFVEMARDLGIERVRIADTVGILTPSKTNILIKDLIKSIPDIKFEFHGHNDLGMATANTIMAIESGVHAVSSTINGIGERSGNASTDEIIMALALNNQLPLGFNLTRTKHLSEVVEKATGINVNPYKPIVGNEINIHESGIHTAGLLRNEKSYTPYKPQSVGAQNTKVNIGFSSGKNAILYKIKSLGLTINEDQLTELNNKIKKHIHKTHRAIRDNEILNLYKHLK